MTKIAGSGSESGSTLKCYGSGTLLLVVRGGDKITEIKLPGKDTEKLRKVKCGK
jgi:hypothetical protein